MTPLGPDGSDLAIRTGKGDWPGQQVEFLLQTQMIVVGAPSLLAQDRPLLDLPWIADHGYAPERELALNGMDIRTLKVVRMDNAVLSVTAAEAGLGLIFASDVVVRESISAGRLVEVEYPPLPVTRYWMVTPEGAQREEVRLFKEWLKEEVGAPA